MKLDTSRLQVSNKVLDRLNELSEYYGEPRSSLNLKAVCHPEEYLALVRGFEKSKEPATSAKPRSAMGKKALLKVACDYIDKWTFDPESPYPPSIEASQAKLDAYDRDEPREGYDEYAAARAALGLPDDPYDEMIERWRADIEQHIAFITHR